MTLGRTRAAGGRYASPESSSSPASIHSKYRAGRISVRIVLVTTHLRSVLSRTLVSSCDTFFRTSAHGRACTWRQSPVVRGGGGCANWDRVTVGMGKTLTRLGILKRFFEHLKNVPFCRTPIARAREKLHVMTESKPKPARNLAPSRKSTLKKRVQARLRPLWENRHGRTSRRRRPMRRQNGSVSPPQPPILYLGVT